MTQKPNIDIGSKNNSCQHGHFCWYRRKGKI